jgi:hypothetical protein
MGAHDGRNTHRACQAEAPTRLDAFSAPQSAATPKIQQLWDADIAGQLGPTEIHPMTGECLDTLGVRPTFGRWFAEAACILGTRTTRMLVQLA